MPIDVFSMIDLFICRNCAGACMCVRGGGGGGGGGHLKKNMDFPSALKLKNIRMCNEFEGGIKNPS